MPSDRLPSEITAPEEPRVTPAGVDADALLQASPNPYVILDPALTIVGMNEAYLRVTMRKRADILGRNMFEAFPSDPDAVNGRQLRMSFERVLRDKRTDHLPLIRYDIPRAGGEGFEERFWSATHTPLLDAGGEVSHILQHTVDVTELQRLRQLAHAGIGAAGPSALVESDVFARAEAVQSENMALADEGRRLRALFEQAPGFMALLQGPRHVFELANAAYLRLVGNRDVQGKAVRDALPDVAGQGFFELLDRVYATGVPYVGAGMRVRLQGDPGGEADDRFVDFIYQPIRDPSGRVAGIFVQGHDITEQKRAEQALQRLNATLEDEVAERTRELRERDEALRQAQKMEVVGQLTGGVAHDFNNLLQVVVGNLEILQRNLPPETARLRRAAENAMTGARRAATLTQRLLAFSRRQPLDPRPLSPNKLVSDMSELLHRTLGETVAVETVLAAGLWLVDADANQLESAVLNLAVNARDAMPGGGKLTIETANTRIDEAYAAQHAEVTPGQYVVICVSDTGTGMSKDTIARAFEPFFTTKEAGKGTGLGLSMVYGFVKQSGGHVKIYSELGHGTCVRIYLPRFLGSLEQDPVADVAAIPEGTHDETVLVVEDDDDVRTYSVEILRELGYRVVEAHDGASALRLLERQARVDLLFTDVVLPGGVTGADLAREALALRPGLSVLFTTGYARDAIVHHGRLDPGVHLITKPFSYADLAQKVRDVLDAEQQSQA
jgi:PAS domain S-box-containing protein